MAPRNLGRLFLQRNQGWFKEKDLAGIWRSSKYYRKRFELLRLMINFDLCFEVGDSMYITPLMLPVDRPSFDWNDNEALAFDYEYDFLPVAIVTLLTVRMHSDIVKSLYWRHGAVFGHQDAVAQVEEDQFNRRIRITLVGSDRRDLLAIIRKNISDIHRNRYTGIQYKEKVRCNCSVCRTSREPSSFNYRTLVKRLKKNMTTYPCDNCLLDINVARLVGEFVDSDSLSFPKRQSTEFNVKIQDQRAGQIVNVEKMSDQAEINFNKMEFDGERIFDFLVALVGQYGVDEVEAAAIREDIASLRKLEHRGSEIGRSHMNNIQSFVMKNAPGIGQSLAANLIFELSKMCL